MKTIGVLLSEARKTKNKSTKEISRETRIKEEFIVAIENERWDTLPEYAVVLGFVKNLSESLGVPVGQARAFLRRDYVSRVSPSAPKQELKHEFVWGPRLTFLLGVTLITLAVIGYLLYQYLSFTSPPKLTVDAPREGQVVVQKSLQVSGKTDSGATVRVNNQPAVIDDEGVFHTEIEIDENTKEVVIRAISRGGKETIVTRQIDVTLSQ